MTLIPEQYFPTYYMTTKFTNTKFTIIIHYFYYIILI
jgi:hypothetical protein